MADPLVKAPTKPIPKFDGADIIPLLDQLTSIHPNLTALRANDSYPGVTVLLKTNEGEPLLGMYFGNHWGGHVEPGQDPNRVEFYLGSGSRDDDLWRPLFEEYRPYVSAPPTTVAKFIYAVVRVVICWMTYFPSTMAPEPE